MSNTLLYIAFALCIVFDIYCLYLLFAKCEKPKGLPKWLWCVIILLSSPGGGILYLLFGHRSFKKIEDDAAH